MPIIDGNQVTIKDAERKIIAEKEGWVVEFHKPRGNYSFVKGNRYVWPIGGLKPTKGTWLGWQTSDLVDGKFCNHIKFDEFVMALGRPLES